MGKVGIFGAQPSIYMAMHHTNFELQANDI